MGLTLLLLGLDVNYLDLYIHISFIYAHTYMYVKDILFNRLVACPCVGVKRRFGFIKASKPGSKIKTSLNRCFTKNHIEKVKETRVRFEEESESPIIFPAGPDRQWKLDYQ